MTLPSSRTLPNKRQPTEATQPSSLLWIQECQWLRPVLKAIFEVVLQTKRGANTVEQWAPSGLVWFSYWASWGMSIRGREKNSRAQLQKLPGVSRNKSCYRFSRIKERLMYRRITESVEDSSFCIMCVPPMKQVHAWDLWLTAGGRYCPQSPERVGHVCIVLVPDGGGWKKGVCCSYF